MNKDNNPDNEKVAFRLISRKQYRLSDSLERLSLGKLKRHRNFADVERSIKSSLRKQIGNLTRNKKIILRIMDFCNNLGAAVDQVIFSLTELQEIQARINNKEHDTTSIREEFEVQTKALRSKWKKMLKSGEEMTKSLEEKPGMINLGKVMQLMNKAMQMQFRVIETGLVFEDFVESINTFRSIGDVLTELEEFKLQLKSSMVDINKEIEYLELTEENMNAAGSSPDGLISSVSGLRVVQT